MRSTASLELDAAKEKQLLHEVVSNIQNREGQPPESHVLLHQEQKAEHFTENDGRSHARAEKVVKYIDPVTGARVSRRVYAHSSRRESDRSSTQTLPQLAKSLENLQEDAAVEETAALRSGTPRKVKTFSPAPIVAPPADDLPPTSPRRKVNEKTSPRKKNNNDGGVRKNSLVLGKESTISTSVHQQQEDCRRGLDGGQPYCALCTTLQTQLLHCLSLQTSLTTQLMSHVQQHLRSSCSCASHPVVSSCPTCGNTPTALLPSCTPIVGIPTAETTAKIQVLQEGTSMVKQMTSTHEL